MRLRPCFGININLLNDYGDIYVGPLEISWCNQEYGEAGSFGIGWGFKGHLYMTYCEPCDPFTGKPDCGPGFLDWELCIHNKDKPLIINWSCLVKKVIRRFYHS